MKKLDKYGNDLEQESSADIYLFYPISDFLNPYFHYFGFLPNHITLLSTFSTLTSIYYYLNNNNFCYFYYFLGYLFDCMDGRMARKYNQKSTLGMMLDLISDNLTNYPLFFIFLFRSYFLVFYKPSFLNVIFKTFVFNVSLGLTLIFSSIFGLNEALLCFRQNENDNFYIHKTYLINNDNWKDTTISKIYLYLLKLVYRTYRLVFIDPINKFNYYERKEILYSMKEFGAGNYNLYILFLMYVFSN